MPHRSFFVATNCLREAAAPFISVRCYPGVLMPRSVGVTTSAVVVIAGSTFTFLLGAVMLFGSAVMPKSSQAARVPMDIGSILITEAIVIFAFAGWGLATGIGLLYLKRWARISLLIFAGILAFISLFSALFVAFIPLPLTNDPNLPANFTSMMRAGMGLFYGAIAALGGFWLYFFNKRSVKAQFQPTQPVPESAAGDLFAGTAVPAPTSDQPARPLSITIIGWFLLITSALTPPSLLVNGALLREIQFPFYFLGIFVFGKSAYLILVLWMAVQFVAAAGLLKLKRWAFFTTIGLQSFAILNGTLLLSIPGHRARLQRIMETMMASMNARMPQPALPPFNFPVWWEYAVSLPIVAVILWFLITRRHAFTSGA